MIRRGQPDQDEPSMSVSTIRSSAIGGGGTAAGTAASLAVGVGASLSGDPNRPVMTMADASTIARTLNENDEENQGPERLYAILEEAVHHPDADTEGQPEDVQRRRREVTDRACDLALRWLRAHKGQEDRAAAASVRGNLEETSLHLICKLQDPSPEVVRCIVEAAPEAAGWSNRHGWLPLHHACANGASGEILSMLVDAYPQGKVAQDTQMRTPLHFYSIYSFGNPVNVPANIRLLSDTGAAALPDLGGKLPIHYACAFGVHLNVLKGLVEANPDSLTAVENDQRTPLHLAMVNAHRSAAIPEVIRFILSQEAGISTVNMRDVDEHLPIHLLARLAKGLSTDKQDVLLNVSDCLRLYLAAEPMAAPDFLTALQSLPRWLQESAVVSPHVRNVLNRKIVQRFPTSVLMLDGYWLIIMIACFEITTTRHIDQHFERERAADPSQVPSVVDGPGTNGALITLFFGVFYFLVREVVQMISLWSLGSLGSWFVDANNWLDVTVITLVLYYSILMAGYEGSGGAEFSSGVAFTKGILWMAVIGFLKSTLVDFAVFVGGVLYVVRRLVAFLLAVAVFLLTFSQIFFIEYKQREECDTSIPTENNMAICNNGEEEFPHCTFERSLLKVYTMMMGEIGTERRYRNNIVAQIIYLLYALLVVVLLSNVLIAIVTDSYEVIKNERAAIVFWSNRLDFVAEIQALQAIKTIVRTQMEKNSARRARQDMSLPAAAIKESPVGESLSSNPTTEIAEQGQDLKGHMRSAWKHLFELFESNFFDDIGLKPSNIEYWLYICYRGVTIFFIIPLWICVGLLTAGWLWPPQIREYLFVQQETAISRAELERQKLDQLKDIQKAITSLNCDIRKEIQIDRDEMLRMRTEVESIHTEFISDLHQVKELMMTLADLGGAQT